MHDQKLVAELVYHQLAFFRDDDAMSAILQRVDENIANPRQVTGNPFHKKHTLARRRFLELARGDARNIGSLLEAVGVLDTVLIGPWRHKK